MEIEMLTLTQLLMEAKLEGYRSAFETVDAENAAQTNSKPEGPAQTQAVDTKQEYVESPDTELPLPEDNNSDEEDFALYSDGFDDGYSEAIEDVKESLNGVL